MSESPPRKPENESSENQSDKIQPSGGWQQPQTPGTWHAPEQAPQSGWRVSALPSELDAQPSDTGGWHLPNPEDTPFTPDDELEVASAPEDALDALADLADDVSDALEDAEADAATEVADKTPAPALLSPEDALFALAADVELEPSADSEPEKAPAAPEDLLFMLEQTDDNDDAFSMSELMALASLVDEEPSASVTQGASAPEIAAVLPPPDDEDSSLLDADAVLSPAEKAVIGASSDANDGGTTQPDPASYAQQQLEALSSLDDNASTGVLNPTAGMPAADPRHEELARRFTETEDEIRSLRQMLQGGQIDQAQFEEQLRQLMILDDDQVWWMMGTETDQWYKFVNNEWALATPPRSATYSPTAGDTFGTLPTLDSQPQPAYDEPDEIELDENYMPIPKSGVSTFDADRTMVGQSYLDHELRSSAETLESVGYGSGYGSNAQATVASPTIQANPVGYGSIEAPYDSAATASPYGDQTAAPTYEQAKQQYQSNLLRNIILGALALLGVAFIVGVIGVVVILQWYNGIVTEYEDQIAQLANYKPEFQTVTILDYQDRPLATFSQGGAERINVKLDDVSPYLLHAIVSAENERFYDDPGWDFIAIVRAFLQNVSAGDIESGASTITQQVARALVLQDGEVSANRKINEIVVAGELTRRYSKDFILELYLNEFFFGNQSYGVEAASKFYFDIPASDLNLPQSAMIAGILQAPAVYDPITNRQATFDQMNVILDRMGKVGCLTFSHNNQQFCVSPQDVTNPSTVLEKARVETRRFQPRQFDLKYPHFVTLVRQQLETAFGANTLYASGYTVKTTLVPELQDFAQDRLDERLAQLAPNGVSTGSIMITDPITGAVRVYIGSPDFMDQQNSGQVDYARMYRQPGSTIKPLLYAAALEGSDRNGNGTLEQNEYYTPASIIWDVPTRYETIPPYSPTNLLNTFYGAVPLRTALQGSYNVSAVKAYEFVGEERFKQNAATMGINWAENAVFGLPSALGSTEVRLYDMMVAYGTIANGGKRQLLHTIESIKDRDGNEIRLPEILRPTPEQAITPQTAYLMQDILSDDATRAASGAFPANSALTLPDLPRRSWVGAKTGTTDGNRDLWTMGFVSNAVVGIWLGRPDNNSIQNLSGFEATAPLWNRIMSEVVRSNRQRPVQFQQPADIVTVPICPDTGVTSGGTCTSPLRNELFAQNRRPPAADQSLAVDVVVNSWTGLRVNDYCPNPEDHVAQTFANISDAAAIAWLNSAAGRNTAQRLNLPIPIEQAPTAACDLNTQVPNASINYPTPNQTLTGEINITGQVSAPPSFSRYQLEYAPLNAQNFQTIGSFSNQQQPNPGSVLATWNTTTVPNGQYTVRLVVIANDGGYIYRSVPVTIDNPLPTPTPTPEPSPTIPIMPTMFETVPPLPFDNPGFDPQPSPTINTSGF